MLPLNWPKYFWNGLIFLACLFRSNEFFNFGNYCRKFWLFVYFPHGYWSLIDYIHASMHFPYCSDVLVFKPTLTIPLMPFRKRPRLVSRTHIAPWLFAGQDKHFFSARIHFHSCCPLIRASRCCGACDLSPGLGHPVYTPPSDLFPLASPISGRVSLMSSGKTKTIGLFSLVCCGLSPHIKIIDWEFCSCFLVYIVSTSCSAYRVSTWALTLHFLWIGLLVLLEESILGMMNCAFVYVLVSLWNWLTLKIASHSTLKLPIKDNQLGLSIASYFNSADLLFYTHIHTTVYPEAWHVICNSFIKGVSYENGESM